MIQDILAQLGLGKKEIAVYLAVCKKGKILPAEISKLTNLNRSTVYSVAAELKKQGIITEDLGSSVKYLVALPPEDLMQLVNQEQQRIETKRKLITEAISELHTFAEQSTYVIPKIVFISEQELGPYLHKQTKKWNESIRQTDKIWWGFQDNTFVEAYGDWIDWYWKQAVPNDVSLRLLSNKSETEKQMKKKGYERRQICFWKESAQFTATVWINGEYVVMIMTREHPYYLVEIHDAVLAANLRGVFQGIWKGLL